MFYPKHVRVFPKIRTCFAENAYMFFQKSKCEELCIEKADNKPYRMILLCILRFVKL